MMLHDALLLWKENCLRVKAYRRQGLRYAGGICMYYCKNCGEPYMSDEAVLCVKCGAGKGLGTNYCHNCGKPVTPDTTVCLSCGVPCYPPVNNYANAKSKVAAGLLGIFLGSFGVHNFYLGYTTKAVIQLVLTVATCGIGAAVSGIWGLVEGILILTGSINVDGKGLPLCE